MGWVIAGLLVGLVGGKSWQAYHFQNSVNVAAQEDAEVLAKPEIAVPFGEIGKIAKEMEQRMELVNKAVTAKPEERPAVAAAMAVLGAFMPLNAQWFLVNHDLVGDPFPWSDEGFDPALSVLPKEMLYICACNFGMTDIENGGLHQFFTNDTGVFAPEMVEGFRLMDMPECAGVMERAIGVFKGEYSRSQEARQTVVEKLVKDAGDWKKVFDALDEELWKSKDYKNFSKKADQFLKERYGIKSAKDRPWPKKP